MPLQDAIYRFGPYELRTRSREVYKHGTRLKLRRQPFQVLHALVERSGDVVTREELRRLLWSAETFVDFEHGLNTSIKELRGLLNDSASEPQFIETLPKLGYRFVAPVESDSPPSAKEPAVQPESAAKEGLPAQAGPVRLGGSFYRVRQALLHRQWPIPVVIALVLVAGLSAYVQWSSFRARSQASGGRTMLAVLPFENLTGDVSQEYFSDGLTEEMIGQLGQLDPQHLGVIARTFIMHYKRTQEPLQQIGRELGVQYVLEGSVRRDSGKVRVSAQLIQMKDQTHLWARQYDREIGSLLALQGEIAQGIADEIELALGSPHSSNAPHQAGTSAPASYEAYDLYLKGLYFWNKRTAEGFQQAADHFQQAIATDPNYARAYAGLANTFGLRSTWQWGPQNELMPKARDAALKALKLDETVAEAHTALALVSENYFYDWATAEREFRRAIQLDPSYATAHQWYGEYLSWQGRFDEALVESERARQLDPLSLIIASDHGSIFYRARQYDRAIAQFRVVLEMDPGSVHACALLEGVYVAEGRLPEALDKVSRCIRPRAEPWADAEEARLYGQWGRTAEAERALAKFEAFARRFPSDQSPTLVKIYLAMGRKEQALALLQKAFGEHSSMITGLKVDSLYDPLRSDPRFQELLRRVGLAQ